MRNTPLKWTAFQRLHANDLPQWTRVQIVLTSMPSIVIVPSHGSRNLCISLVSATFPECPFPDDCNGGVSRNRQMHIFQYRSMTFVETHVMETDLTQDVTEIIQRSTSGRRSTHAVGSQQPPCQNPG